MYLGRRFTLDVYRPACEFVLLCASMAFYCFLSFSPILPDAPAAGAAPASGLPSAARCRLGQAAARGSRQRMQAQLAVRARRGGNVEGPAVPLGPPRPRLGGGELRTLARACAASTQPLRPKFSCCIDNECCCSRPEGGVSSTRISHGVRLKLRLCLTENRWLGSSGVCVS